MNLGLSLKYYNIYLKTACKPNWLKLINLLMIVFQFESNIPNAYIRDKKNKSIALDRLHVSFN